MSDLEGEGGAEPSPPMRMGCRKDTVSLIANSAEFVSIIQTTRVAVPIEKKETEFDRCGQSFGSERKNLELLGGAKILSSHEGGVKKLGRREVASVERFLHPSAV